MENTLVFDSRFSGRVSVKLEVNSYMNNGRLYLGLTETGGEYPEPFADITVNIDAPCPPYCGYVDTNICPDLEEFIVKNGLGEFMDMTGHSGFCQYPLYRFHAEKLRELEPYGMEVYEQGLGLERRQKEMEKEENALKIRPLTEEERKYAYSQSVQLQGQTGSIGHLRGDFGRNGKGFYSTWFDHQRDLKTDAFKKELDSVINALRSEEYGILQNRKGMTEYAVSHPDCAFDGNWGMEGGFRIDTEKHSYLLRCNPAQGDYNFYCYCYVSESLNRQIENARNGIRFIDPSYQELFRILDGGSIVISYSDEEKIEKRCRFIDEYHTQVGGCLYHICEFAEFMKKNSATYEAKKQDEIQKERSI